MALASLHVTIKQHELFKKASGIFDRVVERGGIEKATDEDLDAMIKVHQELRQAHDDLYELRQKKLDELGIKSADQIGSDIEAAGV
jgi:hypothetical protein